MFVKEPYYDPNNLKGIWEDNSFLRVIKEFNDLYNKDSSTKKINSSTIFWFIYLTTDYNSRFAHIPIGERIEIVEENLIKSKGFYKENKKILEPLIKVYNELQKDSERRYLETLNNKFEERRKYLDNTQYNEITWEKIDKILLITDKILSQYDKVLERVNKQESNQIKGSIQLSLSAKGELYKKDDNNLTKEEQKAKDNFYTELDNETNYNTL